MKININKLNIIPKKVSNTFGLCTYKKNGNIDPEINDWINFHQLKTEDDTNYINIYIGDFPLSYLFTQPLTYKYMDGFSPNLNKYLHIGHMSNLVLAKAIKSLNICEKTVSIYGDTLQGNVTKSDAINMLKIFQSNFNLSTYIKCLLGTNNVPFKSKNDLLL